MGRVTLVSDDRIAEYTYQTTFDDVPQILYGFCGFDFDLNARDTPAPQSYGYSGYAPAPAPEPNTVGFRVNAYSSKTTVIIEGTKLSFGDTTFNSADICFQACSIGPGSGPVDH